MQTGKETKTRNQKEEFGNIDEIDGRRKFGTDYSGDSSSQKTTPERFLRK